MTVVTHPGMANGIKSRRRSRCLSDENVVELTESQLASKSHHICRARLKHSATMSAILCAFALQSMAELQVNVPTRCPQWLFTMFAICTTTLIAVHISALVISNFILPSIEFMTDSEKHLGLINAYPNNDQVKNFVEIAWTFSTIFGLFLFLIEIVLLCWVKFYDHSLMACWAGTVAVSPFIAAFLALCIYFQRELSVNSRKARHFRVEDKSHAYFNKDFEMGERLSTAHPLK